MSFNLLVMLWMSVGAGFNARRWVVVVVLEIRSMVLVVPCIPEKPC